MNTTGSILRSENASISLRDLFWSVTAKWRQIVCLTLLITLLFAGYKGVSSYSSLSDPATVHAIEESNESAQKAYESNKSVLESRIDTVSQLIDQENEYEQNSLLFSIDPYNVSVSEKTYYIDTDYTILPGSSFQNPNYSVQVVNAYKAVINSIAIEPILGQKTSDKRDIFLTVTVDPEHGLFSVRTIGADPDQAVRIMEEADKAIQSAAQSIRSDVHDHQISCIAETQYQAVSEELYQLHEDHQSRLKSLTKGLADAVAEYESLKVPQLEPITTRISIKGIVKFAIFGFVIGAVLSVLLYAVPFILRNAVASPDDMARRYNAATLGMFTDGRKANRIDRSIASHRGLVDLPAEKAAALSAANIRQVAGDNRKILLAGDVKKESIAELSRHLSPQLEGFELLCGGNICEDPDSVCALSACDALILVEELGVSRHDTIVREADKAFRLGKPVLGFILNGKARA